MTIFTRIIALLIISTTLISTSAYASEDIYRLRMYFGLSLPGGHSVSLNEWQHFEQNRLAKTFTGFNVVDSIGYYQGKAERSKIVTIILKEKELAKAKGLAKEYAKQFNQESVMMVKMKVQEWSFVSAD